MKTGMGYHGPERRLHPGPTQVVPFRHFALLFAALALAVTALLTLAAREASDERRNRDRLLHLDQKVDVANETAENAKVVADFIRDCIFYAEEGKCPVKNLQIIKEDNPAGNPKPSTTTTATTKTATATR